MCGMRRQAERLGGRAGRRTVGGARRLGWVEPLPLKSREPMKRAASTRHARVLEGMPATACAEESAPAWTCGGRRGWEGELGRVS